MRKIKKLFMIGVLLITMSFSTGCSGKTTAQMVHQYSIHFAELINVFAIASQSETVSCVGTSDSVKIEYANGDTLQVLFAATHVSPYQKISVEYKSGKLLSSQELDNAMRCLFAGAYSEELYNTVVLFSNTYESAEVEADKYVCRLSYEDGVLCIDVE